MNQINPKKLPGSKWTAVIPKYRQKHFIVSDVEFDEDGLVIACAIEAVISKKTTAINWRDLQDESHWVQGWK